MPFAALAAALVLEERLSPIGLTGCSVILVSVLGAEVLPLLKNTMQAQRNKSAGERNNL
jgi:drug/metabolite transporter (DMT)-like permease